MAILAIINGFYVPYEIAFGLEYFTELHVTIGCFFLVDLILQFNVTVFDDKTGDEIVQKSEIAKKYVLTPDILIDILAIVPLVYSSNNHISI